ncbi:flagellar basal body P-ring formation chaperone FlgA [Thermosulfurimonas dismutans]|uniref:Flagella basal body P-ring formation protein FlgA n=1 Tax=Thermosulfurimonas dismutans TaxID=999894 RepID=A0A179D336_9BACT|nr:flagellar basal body P-ring formation chaperone FlgA [Thermosulfurimonas dismutans]OAQ20477.1 Flagellar basal-body P-ring formation protein FlgA [Thermosulfurimonas dismutans]
MKTGDFRIGRVLIFLGFLALWSFIVLLWASSFVHAKRLEESYFRELFQRVVAERLPWPTERIEILRLAVEPLPVEIPDGAEERIHFVNHPQAGSNTLLVDYLKDGRLIARVRLVGYVEVLLPVVVLSRPVARGAILTKEVLALEPRPLTRLPHDVLTDPSQALGKRVKYSLSAGKVLRLSQIEKPPIIRRNQIVKILARTSYLTVVAKGQARQDGRMGEIIRVRNLSSKKEIYARVVSSDTVEVSF